MKLGELKRSLSRFPPDMDDTEILIQYVNNDGKADADLLIYVGYIKLKDDVKAISLGTWKAADQQQKLRPAMFPADYKSHPDTHK